MVRGKEGMVGGREGATEKTLRLIMSLSFRNSFSVMRFQSGPAAARVGHSDLRPSPSKRPTKIIVSTPTSFNVLLNFMA